MWKADCKAVSAEKEEGDRQAPLRGEERKGEGTLEQFLGVGPPDLILRGMIRARAPSVSPEGGGSAKRIGVQGPKVRH